MKAFDLVSGVPWAMSEEGFAPFADWAASADIDPQSLAAFQGRPMDGTERMSVRDGVATLPVRGMIFRHDTPLTRFLTTVFGGSITEHLAADFNAALANPDVRQILLSVDSPGGHAAGIGELAQMIHASSKPVVAYVGSQAASAGYYLPAAASSVVVAPSAMLGSIGVVVEMSRKRASDPIEIVSSQSPYKRSDPETEAGKANIQGIVDAMASVFINDVARFRGLDPERVQSDFGQGGMKIGRAAVDAGMADHVGSYEQTLELMRKGMPPRRAPRPAPKKAEPQPRRAAMSEPNAETTPAISAAEAADLRKQLADFQARAAASDEAAAKEITARIATEAKAFATEIISAQSRATPGERDTIVDAYAQAARDDHDHPVAGKPTQRQDQVRAIYEKRTSHNLTKEVVASDAAHETRALASDPAAETKVEDAQARARRDRDREENQEWARKYQGAAAKN